jgi:hypothetical protein
VSVVIETRGLDALQALFDQLPEVADEAARLALNDTARFARRLGSKKVREEVAFRPRYLGNDDEGALSVAKFASSNDGEAVVRARNDARSLASFATGRPRFGKAGAKVKVSGSRGPKRMDSAFYMKLRRGNNDIDGENYNVGLAIRLKKGERVSNKRQMKALGGGLYLLYGPSVAQVFDDVAIEMQGEVSDYLANEFVRQFERLSNGQ